MGFLGDITGGLLGESSAEKASKKSRRLAGAVKAETLAELSSSYGEIKTLMSPYIQTGGEALQAYKQELGVAPDVPVFDEFDFDFTKMEDNPAYQFVREQGLRAVERIQAKNRALGSGQRITAAIDYASGLASTEYENEFRRQLASTEQRNQARMMQYGAETDRYGRRLSGLSGLATMGANVSGNLAGFRQQLAGGRSAAIAGHAADVTAARLVPVQEKQAFVSNLMDIGGKVLGAS